MDPFVALPKFHRSINYIAAQLRLQRKERKKKVAELAAVVVTESSNNDTLKRPEEYTDELHSDIMNVMMDLEPLKALKVKVDEQLADMHYDLKKLLANANKELEIIRYDIAEVAEEVDDVKAEAVRSEAKDKATSSHCFRGAFDFDDDFSPYGYTDWIRCVNAMEDAPAPKARKIKGKTKSKGKCKDKDDERQGAGKGKCKDKDEERQGAGKGKRQDKDEEWQGAAFDLGPEWAMALAQTKAGVTTCTSPNLKVL